MTTYLIGNDVNELIKIGKTYDVSKRVKQISGQLNFVNLQIIHSLEGDHETALHYQFAHKRKEGEWFELSQEDIENILSQYSSLKVNPPQTKRRKTFGSPVSVYLNPENFFVLSKIGKPSRVLLDYICLIIHKNDEAFTMKFEDYCSFINGHTADVKSVFYRAVRELIAEGIISKAGMSTYRINKSFIK